MDDIKAKQQIVEKIKSSTNILVTVSNDPSVDALSALLGFTLLLDKLEKHATAVFSGAVPPAITFLEPEKTFESTSDSLRDFIIAIDKEKADHLKYKVEGDMVKIFITPYKTTINSDDLEFSQGDYNVELVIALGVDNQDHLDAALDAHGKILHDAAIITVTAGDQTSSLGGVDWHDAQASSLSEMLAGLAEAMKTDKATSLLDAQTATAFLTGIVAATDRFSNTHTTARVMTIAAQLMAAGADQQLIAAKLEASHEIHSGVDSGSAVTFDATTPTEPQKKEGLSISHKPNETLEEMDKRVKAAEQAEAAEAASEALASKKSDESSTAPVPDASTPAVTSAYALDDQTIEPSLGGTLSATTEQAAEDARKAAENEQNKTILTHSYLDSSPTFDTPVNAVPVVTSSEPEATTGALADVHSAYALDEQPAEAAPSPEPVSAPEAPAVVPSEPAVPNFFASTPAPTQAPSTPPTPADVGLPMPPAIPDFSNSPIGGSAPVIAPPIPTTPPPERLGDILAPEPAPSTSAPIAPQALDNNPAQFKIPGQP